MNPPRPSRHRTTRPNREMHDPGSRRPRRFRRPRVRRVGDHGLLAARLLRCDRPPDDGGRLSLRARPSAVIRASASTSSPPWRRRRALRCWCSSMAVPEERRQGRLRLRGTGAGRAGLRDGAAGLPALSGGPLPRLSRRRGSRRGLGPGEHRGVWGAIHAGSCSPATRRGPTTRSCSGSIRATYAGPASTRA